MTHSMTIITGGYKLFNVNKYRRSKPSFTLLLLMLYTSSSHVALLKTVCLQIIDMERKSSLMIYCWIWNVCCFHENRQTSVSFERGHFALLILLTLHSHRLTLHLHSLTLFSQQVECLLSSARLPRPPSFVRYYLSSSSPSSSYSYSSLSPRLS